MGSFCIYIVLELCYCVKKKLKENRDKETDTERQKTQRDTKSWKKKERNKEADTQKDRCSERQRR